jgi:hypothetical protein
MTHHRVSYPAIDFYGDKTHGIEKAYGTPTPSMWQIMNPKNGMVMTLHHEGPLYLFMIIIFIFGMKVLKTSWTGLAFVFVFYAVQATVMLSMHMSFHVRGFWMERYSWYMELRALHYIHHLYDMQSNLGMVNMGIDVFFGSLETIDPLKKVQGKMKQEAEKIELEHELPEKLHLKYLNSAVNHAGLVALILGFDVSLDFKPRK